MRPASRLGRGIRRLRRRSLRFLEFLLLFLPLGFCLLQEFRLLPACILECFLHRILRFPKVSAFCRAVKFLQSAFCLLHGFLGPLHLRIRAPLYPLVVLPGPAPLQFLIALLSLLPGLIVLDSQFHLLILPFLHQNLFRQIFRIQFQEKIPLFHAVPRVHQHLLHPDSGGHIHRAELVFFYRPGSRNPIT